MDEFKFWQIIDNAWKSDSDLTAFRDAVLETLTSSDSKDSLEEEFGEEGPMIPNEEDFLEAIRLQIDSLKAEELLEFDRILERKLYEIDREDVHEHTDGSDDGFLYCRGFILAIGQRYYDAVNSEPENAMFDWECESITYISANLYEDKFGELPKSDICRETGSNEDGW